MLVTQVKTRPCKFFMSITESYWACRSKKKKDNNDYRKFRSMDVHQLYDKLINFLNWLTICNNEPLQESFSCISLYVFKLITSMQVGLVRKSTVLGFPPPILWLKHSATLQYLTCIYVISMSRPNKHALASSHDIEFQISYRARPTYVLMSWQYL